MVIMCGLARGACTPGAMSALRAEVPSMRQRSLLKGLLLPAAAAIMLPLIAAIALPTALLPPREVTVVVRATPPAGTREVLLTGSMDGWSVHRLHDSDGDGTFEIAVSAPPGTYEYRLSADGRPLAGEDARPDGSSVLRMGTPGGSGSR
jgi:hypothetical protein